MGCKDRIGPTDVYIDERLLQCFKYFMGNKDIFQAHNRMKCLGGAKPACTITLGGGAKTIFCYANFLVNNFLGAKPSKIFHFRALPLWPHAGTCLVYSLNTPKGLWQIPAL